MKKHVIIVTIVLFAIMILPMTIAGATLPAPVMTEDVESAVGGPGISDPYSETNPFVNCKIYYGNPNSYLLAGVAQKSNSSLAKYVINGNQSVYCDNLGETALEYNQFAVTNDSTAGFLDNTTYVATMLFKFVTPLATDGNLYFTLRTWTEKDKAYYPTFILAPNPDNPGEFSTAVENSKSILNKITVKKLSENLICVSIRFQTSTCSDPSFKDKWMFFFGVKNQAQIALDDFKLFESTSDPKNFFQTASGVMENETEGTSSAVSSSATSQISIDGSSSSNGTSVLDSSVSNTSENSFDVSAETSSENDSADSAAESQQESAGSDESSDDISTVSASGNDLSGNDSEVVSGGSSVDGKSNTGILITVVISLIVLAAAGITFYMYLSKKKSK